MAILFRLVKDQAGASGIRKIMQFEENCTRCRSRILIIFSHTTNPGIMKHYLLLFSLFLSLAGMSQAKKLTYEDYAQKPYWIQMMEVEGVNFNETLKAYDIYWQHHDLPEEEGDRYIGKGDQKKKKLSKKELKERREAMDMRFQLKKFEHWKIKNEPFVKEDGTIMTADERLKFHNQHQ